MRYLLTILLYLSTQAQGQALFFQHNTTSAPAIPQPSDITNLKAWYRADMGVTGTTSVTSWADQSGNGYTLTAPTGKEPALSASAIGGQPALSFSSDRLIHSTFSQAQGFTLIVVYQASSNANASIVDSYNPTQCALWVGSTNFQFSAGSNAGHSPADDYANLHIVRASGTSSDYTLNNTPATAISPGTNGYSGLSIGDLRGNPNPIIAGYSFSGYIAEIIIYSRTLSDTELSDIKTYIDNRYNLW